MPKIRHFWQFSPRLKPFIYLPSPIEGIRFKRKNPTIGRIQSEVLDYQARPERGAATVGETTTGGDLRHHEQPQL
jgi:hypothetical protein